MSRDAPQFKLRMPVELRSKVAQASKASGRSINAELVARLEASFMATTASGSLIPAARARELAVLSLEGLSNEIRERAISSINRSVSLGQRVARVVLHDLALNGGFPEGEMLAFSAPLTEELQAEGYEVEWDGVVAILIRF